MSENPAETDSRKGRPQTSKAPAIDDGIFIFPIAHNVFLARWSMSPELLEAGLRTASPSTEDAHQVLRAYSLPSNSERSDFSSTWKDYGIEGLSNSAKFTLPTTAAKINAVIGVINRSGDFCPLLRGHPINLPAPPAAPLPDKKLCPEMKPFQASGHRQAED